MCEIFSVKFNPYGHYFSQESLRVARNLNPDGAGFVVFKPNQDGKYEVKNSGKFPAVTNFLRKTYKHTVKTYPSYQSACGFSRMREIPPEKKYPTTVGQVLDDMKSRGVDDEEFLAEAAAREDEYWAERLTEAGKIKGKIGEMAVERVIAEMEASEKTGWVKNKDGILTPKGADSTTLFSSFNKKNTDIAFVPTAIPVPTTVEETIEEFVYKTQMEDDCVESIYKVQTSLEPGELLIIHFRYGTAGHLIEENTHPISSEKYLVVHNGVFGYRSLPVGFNDSRHFTSVITKKSRKMKLRMNDYRREENMLRNALKEALGYHSVFIYSFITNQLYYFKSDKANFFWDSSGLLGATKPLRFPNTTFEAVDIILRPKMLRAV